MTYKESYDEKVVGLARKYHSSSNPKKRIVQKKIKEHQLIVEYIEQAYAQETRDLEAISKKSASIDELEQRYSSY